MNRAEQIDKLNSQSPSGFDIIVVGGGATGLGTALDAASRGYKTLLLEKNDFSSSTTSKSTKLVHGGVRYLKQGDIFLVAEALRERSIMLKNAPHITHKQEFIIPVYSYWDVLLYTVGLKFYDFLAGGMSLGKSRFLNRKKTLAALPHIKNSGLKGGISYIDGQFDDSRMAIALAKECAKQGGIVLNYFGVDGLLKGGNGRVCGVEATDGVTGKKYTFRSRLVINATGVFANELIKIDDPLSKSILRPSQGLHIVIDSHFLDSSSAIMIPKTDDGRVLFAIPWHGKVVVGTTDTPVTEISLEPKPLEEEIEFIIRNFKNYSSIAPTREELLSVYAGLRPLAHNPDKPMSTKEISRRHKIIYSASGLLTIIGGKWTTYRLMAEEAIDSAINAGIIPPRECKSRDLGLNKKPKKLEQSNLSVYGDEPLSSAFPYTKGEIVWICRSEMAVNLSDVLARRTRALLLNARESAKIAPEVASIMAHELGHDKEWVKQQIDEYNKLVSNYI